MRFSFTPESVTHTFIEMTPSLASAWLSTKHNPRQRPIDQSYVDEYALLLRRGEFRPWSDIHLSELDGKEQIENGQHTLAAIIKSGVTVLLSVLTYHCSSDWEQQALYLTFDRNRVRSLDQLYEAYSCAERFKMPKNYLSCFGGAMPLLASGFEPNASYRRHVGALLHAGVIRIAMMEDWVREANDYYEVLKGAPKGISAYMRQRKAIIALALVTIRHTGLDALEFWHNVAFDDMLGNQDPQSVTHKWILANGPSQYPQHIYARYLVDGWNHAFEETTIRELKLHDPNTPIRIAGTPHTEDDIIRYLSEEGDSLHPQSPQHAPV